MIISGPNAGGKTVALKTMGLAALMVRCGIPVACDEGSHIGLFDVVLTDVGDDQSLQKNLSTFSAHVQNLAAVLRETTRGALVLLDELAGGTDPREGEALAAGILDSLCARGGAVVVATHYEGLKALALVDPRFTNASVGFDPATMMPTFELAMGVPGRSSALAVARRFGMPATVIERAERFLAREDQDFETVVKKLHDERAALALARGAAEDREREAAETRTALEAELERARNRERKALSQEAHDLVERLRRARDDLHEAQTRLRSKKIDAPSVREAEHAIERAASEVAIGGPLEHLVNPPEGIERERVPLHDLRKGARVWVQRLRAEAEVIDLLGEGNVRIAAGPLKLTVPSSELRVAAIDVSVPRQSRGRASGPTTPAFDRGAHLPPQARDNTCDLRGLRADDAVAMTQSFLDRALGAGQDVVFLLHGYGSGALREAIRKELARVPHVAGFRGGDTDGGGEGVTVVWLA
jgi:DNA mismatch repair protein MutS2